MRSLSDVLTGHKSIGHRFEKMIAGNAMTSRNSWSKLAWLAPILPEEAEETTDAAIHPRRPSPTNPSARLALRQAAREQRLAEVYSPGMPILRLAAEAECNPNVARRWLGVAQPKRSRKTDQSRQCSERSNARALVRAEFERRFSEIYIPGISAIRLAAQAGCSEVLARRWIDAREGQQQTDHGPASKGSSRKAPTKKRGPGL